MMIPASAVFYRKKKKMHSEEPKIHWHVGINLLQTRSRSMEAKGGSSARELGLIGLLTHCHKNSTARAHNKVILRHFILTHSP